MTYSMNDYGRFAVSLVAYATAQATDLAVVATQKYEFRRIQKNCESKRWSVKRFSLALSMITVSNLSRLFLQQRINSKEILSILVKIEYGQHRS